MCNLNKFKNARFSIFFLRAVFTSSRLLEKRKSKYLLNKKARLRLSFKAFEINRKGIVKISKFKNYTKDLIKPNF